MGWKPGQSGNPRGNPRRHKATSAIVSPREWQELVKAQLASALAGDKDAAKWIGDRIEAPRQRQELAGVEDAPIALQHAESVANALDTDTLSALDKLADELAAKVNESRGNGAAAPSGNGSAGPH